MLSAHILVSCLTSSDVEEKGWWRGHACLAQGSCSELPRGPGLQQADTERRQKPGALPGPEVTCRETSRQKGLD